MLAAQGLILAAMAALEERREFAYAAVASLVLATVVLPVLAWIWPWALRSRRTFVAAAYLAGIGVPLVYWLVSAGSAPR